MPKFGLSKQERLCRKKIIEQLFSQGSVVFLHPFRISYTTKKHSDASLPQILISVPRKNFKRAVKRNWLKRRIREAYRLNKYLLQNPENQYFNIEYIAWVYIAKDLMPTAEVTRKVQRALQKLYAATTTA